MLDRVDRNSLRILQAEEHVATIELAERCGLSATATGKRFKRLARDGYVTGFGAKVDPHKLERGLLIFIEIALDKATPDVFDPFADAVRKVPDILECHMAAGGYDYRVESRVVGMPA
ncbi:hypothetical protein GCM10007886_10360 [Methylobacterium gregans]|uniref:Leucine-responsive regulatory protein n=1 Tax=Methylobacterium gregans TaxID=374424 RepID=A0AA37HPJ1_9HYPH|nr:Lrp/AsnC family leucine-responsive transcriptional regulator [Methylobacterium gregans]GJD79280.1 Leucine-responsive regulatory protein [Methylobacterium gregans]GLS52853.1 hypothetical protein GCM10007886_10360 [Methylobacterium gregans]